MVVTELPHGPRHWVFTARLWDRSRLQLTDENGAQSESPYGLDPGVCY